MTSSISSPGKRERASQPLTCRSCGSSCCATHVALWRRFASSVFASPLVASSCAAVFWPCTIQEARRGQILPQEDNFFARRTRGQARRLPLVAAGRTARTCSMFSTMLGCHADVRWFLPNMARSYPTKLSKTPRQCEPVSNCRQPSPATSAGSRCRTLLRFPLSASRR